MDTKQTKKIVMLRYEIIKSNLPKTMQTIIFNQVKKDYLKNNLSLKDIKKLIQEIKKEIEKDKKEEFQGINFTCNIF